MTDPGSELVEWVDGEGRVLGVVPRAEVRARNLLHRSVAVVVRSPGGEVLVHRRAPWKDVWPGLWDLAFGGVLGVGERWEVGARRELAEEAGVEAGVLQHLGSYRYRDEQVAALCEAFAVEHAGPFDLADGEVTEVAWVPMRELTGWVESHPVCPDSVIGLLPLLHRASAAG